MLNTMTFVLSEEKRSPRLLAIVAHVLRAICSIMFWQRTGHVKRVPDRLRKQGCPRMVTRRWR